MNAVAKEVCTAIRDPAWPNHRIGCTRDAPGGCARYKPTTAHPGETFADIETVAIARTLSAWRCPNFYEFGGLGPEAARDFQETQAMRWRLAQLRGTSCQRREQLRAALSAPQP